MSYIDRLKVNNEEYDIHDKRFEEGTQYSDGSKVIGNDYEKDGVLYPATAGMKAFCWSAVSNSELRYTFTITDGTSQAHPTVSVPAGALVSVKADYSWSFAGTLVNAITTSSTQVVVDITRTPPSNWNPSQYINDQEDGYLWFPDVPEAGVVSKGNGAVTLGEGNRANEEGATAAGRQNIADGRYSFAVGRGNKAGYSGFAEGQNTSSIGLQSHSEGLNTTASGNRSHAEGSDSKATGDKSHAEGQSTEATGINSHAEGWSSLASGDNSHAEGLWTKATQDSQHTQGKYNVLLGSDYVDIVGWGTANNSRKNISVLDKSGNLYLAGKVYVQATNNNCTSGTELVNTLEQKNTVSSNNDYRVLLTYTANDTDVSEIARKSSKLKFNPSSGILNVATSVQVNGNTSYKDNLIEFEQGDAQIGCIAGGEIYMNSSAMEIDSDDDITLPSCSISVARKYITINGKRLYLSDTAPTDQDIPVGSVGLGW